MCGIAGAVSLGGAPIPHLRARLELMGRLIEHRGPDGKGVWVSTRGDVGFAHRRLAVIDLSDAAAQPMHGEDGCTITYNGEIYNHPELRQALQASWTFRTSSDTEVILAAHARHPRDFVDDLRGMFAFAIWDERRRELSAARDRFGIKPLYYCVVEGVFYFASEAKALVPMLPTIQTDLEALGEYLTFQYLLEDRTLFAGISQLAPGHRLRVTRDGIDIERYWDVHYDIDYDSDRAYFHRRLRDLLDDSVRVHLRSDVEVGAYVSGGVDSSLIARLASAHESAGTRHFHGRFAEFDGYDESQYAAAAVEATGGHLDVVDITADDFERHLRDVIYHLDHPVAGPGAFPQYMVSALAAEHVKVVLGGQGGDEIFGGYARYLIAYFEQCIKAAIDGTYRNGNYVVTIESIVPNLGVLREYTPLLAQFWGDGLFGPIDERYFRLINRSVDAGDEITWELFDREALFERYRSIFNNRANVRKEALFDSMTHFDFKCLLPALLHVEDRMSMAHGIESRVPLLDHPLVEFAASVPADVKFEGGQMKHLLKEAFAAEIPPAIAERRDKMGFPVPLSEWFSGRLQPFASDLLHSMADHQRPGIDPHGVRQAISNGGRFSRKAWGLISLELWYQLFHDQAATWRGRLSTMIDEVGSDQMSEVES